VTFGTSPSYTVLGIGHIPNNNNRVEILKVEVFELSLDNHSLAFASYFWIKGGK
jgi:hypothetical protein